MKQSDNNHKVQGTLANVPLSGELLASILDNLDGIIYVADFETHEILFANKYLKNLFGFDPTGKKCWHFMHSKNGRSCEFCNSGELFNANGEPRGVVCREYQNPFDQKWYAAKDQVIKWSNGRYVRLEIAMDITGHKQLEQLLTEARKQAEIATDAKNRFVALVAHDLKSPFVSILGMLKRILQKETFTYEVHRKFLENIMTNGQRILKMIDNLLDIDRLETGAIKPELSYFDVADMVVDVFKNFGHLAETKELTLENRIPPGTEIYADKYLYFVVLNNLISNAVKFSFSHGTITVSYDMNGDIPRLAVKDGGRGISKDFLVDIFRQDVKTTTPGTMGEPGSGLGLIFCQEIMKAHGGRIQIESVEGEGATFYVVLGPSCRLQSRPKSRPGKSKKTTAGD